MQTQTSSSQNKSAGMSSSLVECFQECSDCYKVCAQLIDYCLTKGGTHAEAQHIKLLQDCSFVCQLSADFMIRNSKFHSSVCKICADICKECAKSCEALAAGDETMKACIVQCRKCATSCEKMSTLN